MKLRRQLIGQIVALLVGMVLIALAALWGLNGLRQDFSVARHAYNELRDVYEVGYHIAQARRIQSFGVPYRQFLHTEVEAASRKLAELDSVRRPVAPVREALDRQQLDAALERLAAVVDAVRGEIQSVEEAANRKRLTTMAAVGALSAIVLLVAGAIALGQYRAIVRPLASLQRATRTMAGGRFEARADETGPAELAALASDFNQMAARLETLYKNLEENVAAKSRQLVRSERLAGVGFLAAGVAHEINNPLGIIAGHAELWLSEHQKDPQKSAREAPQTLKLVAEEAFRCKRIIEKLLTLSRGSEKREPIALADVVEVVAGSLAGLKQYDGKTIEIHCPDPDSTEILASESEMKQVILNLLINATEAVQSGSGRIDITVRRAEQWVELIVQDNGRGMTPATLTRLFEPFFSDKHRDGSSASSGVGLGLSITHAIVTNHGGRIDATSAGEGMGSRFVVQFPAESRSGASA